MRLIILLTSFFFLFSCQKGTVNEYTKYLNHNDTVKYVGKETCKQCHFEIYTSFMETGMGKSMQQPIKENSDISELFAVFDSDKNLFYKPFWKNDSIWLHEFRLSDKDTIHSIKRKVNYIIGSGHHTNSHLFEINGYVHQMPYTFYTQKQIADLPPGFENGNNTRFNREIGIECMSCHNAYPHHVEGSTNKYAFIPTGIDCERCHGPGELHVKQKQQGVLVDTTKYIDYSIVNPKRLDLNLQFELCQRCHLQGTAILQEGKTFLDFKPGQHLSEVLDVYIPKYKNDDSFIMASHSDRLQQSACFSSEKISCTTCHNPHKSVRTLTENYFDRKCMQCHDVCSQEDNVSDCISCHMPKSSSIDIPHISITDHKIGVHKKYKTQEIREFLGLFSINNSNPTNLSKAKAYLKRFEAFEQNPIYLDSAKMYLDKLNTKEAYNAFIQYHYLKSDYQSIINYAMQFEEHAFTPSQDLALTFSRIAESYSLFEMYEESIGYYKKAINLAPYKLQFQLKIGAIYTKLRKFDLATEYFENIINMHPYQKEAYSNLGYLSIQNQQYLLAERYLKQAINLDPDYIKAYENISLLYLHTEKNDSARMYLSKILEIAPNNNSAKQILKQLN